MEHYFELPVMYKGAKQTFKGQLATFGYVYKFYIMADGQELVFETYPSAQTGIVANH